MVSRKIASSSALYGGTYNMFPYTLPKPGVKVVFAAGGPDDFSRAITPKTKALYNDRYEGRPESKDSGRPLPCLHARGVFNNSSASLNFLLHENSRHLFRF
ncbi:MAG: PLP-dependent transferase [Acidaminococcales bacterium]|nr:PLP-dependent transferase [Acidaminococcales bacterium]